MNKSQVERQDDGTIKVTITLDEKSVKTTHEQVIAELAKQANVAGFRKGKAPRELVEEKLNKDQIREEILKKLLPAAYMEALQENNIRPIMNPKMHVEAIEEGKDWVVSAMTCEMPEVKLGKYKDAVKKLTAKTKIAVPGKEEESKKPSINEITTVILKEAEIKVPAILIEQETDRLLSQLLNDVKRLGLSLDQYLGSTKRTAEDLRAEYAKKATDDIKLEFILQSIAEEEKITVDEKEIAEAIQQAKNPAEKQNLEANKYMLAGILRQQKTLDFLMNL